MQSHLAKNPFQQQDELSAALDVIVAENSNMLEVYLNNLSREISELTDVPQGVVDEAFKSADFAAPFPLDCVTNLSDAGKVFEKMHKKVSDEEAAMKNASQSVP